jgi:hypothetical protein
MTHEGSEEQGVQGAGRAQKTRGETRERRTSKAKGVQERRPYVGAGRTKTEEPQQKGVKRIQRKKKTQKGTEQGRVKRRGKKVKKRRRG